MKHITPAMIEAYRSGEIEEGELVGILLHHLLDQCPTCRRALLGTGLDDLSEQRSRAQSLDEAIEAVIHRVPGWQLNSQSLREVSEDALAMLSDQSPAIGDDLLPNPHIVLGLLERAHRQVSRSPTAAIATATLAHEITLKMAPGLFGRQVIDELELEARAEIANAHRAGGDLRTADRWMEGVLAKVDDLVADPLVQAKVYGMVASLRKDQRRFDEADEFADLAVSLFRELRMVEDEAQVLLKQASIKFLRGSPAQAIDSLKTILDLVDPQEHRFTWFCAQHNLATYLAAEGRAEEARKLLRSASELHAEFAKGSNAARLSWLEAMITEGLGEKDEASALYAKSQQQFLELGNGYLAALVTLDLALLLLKRGKTAEVKELALEMVPIFESQDIHREALSALMLFQGAAVAEIVTIHQVRRIADYLAKAQNDPSFRFEEGS